MNICAKCKFYGFNKPQRYCIVFKDPYRCYAENIIDPITGCELSISCKEKNPTGECKDFVQKEQKKPNHWWSWLTG